MNPLSEDNVWKSPIVQHAFSEGVKSRILGLLAEKDHLFAVNDRLPQVLCHNDAHRRNLMWTRSNQTGQEELIALDWSFMGAGAVGNDLGELVGTSLYFLDYPIDEAEVLSASVLENYILGIEKNGVTIDPRLVKLGYLIGLTFWMGTQLPGWAAIMLPPESGVNIRAMYGHTPEEVLASWVELEAFILNHSNMILELIQDLKL